jgi:hypothetical protein
MCTRQTLLRTYFECVVLQVDDKQKTTAETDGIDNCGPWKWRGIGRPTFSLQMRSRHTAGSLRMTRPPVAGIRLNTYFGRQQPTILRKPRCAARRTPCIDGTVERAKSQPRYLSKSRSRADRAVVPCQGLHVHKELNVRTSGFYRYIVCSRWRCMPDPDPRR